MQRVVFLDPGNRMGRHLSQSVPHSTVTRWIFLTLFGVLFVWFFFKVLVFGEGFAYRDSAHFYQPLFQFVQKEWQAGRIPLWNPNDNCGTPLAANAATSIFYPGKAVFFLPIPFHWSFKIYILGHFFLAGVSAYVLARRFQISVLGSTLCAASYTFSGNVLFQYCNVVFLVGAAWLPAAILASEIAIRRRRVWGAISLGIIMSLMVLGGDAQMAYHVGLLAALYALVLWRSNESEVTEAGSQAPGIEELQTRRSRFFHHRLTLLSIATVAGLLLSLVQVLPSLEWSKECLRNHWVVPRNVFELRESFSRDRSIASLGVRSNWYDHLLARPINDAPSHGVYQFSVAPWRVGELIWPWISGASLSQHRRWTHAFAMEMDWVPSMYLGLLPICLLLCTLRFRGADPRLRWISLIVVLSLVASFGSFGLGWIMRVLAGLWSENSQDEAGFFVGDAFGGLYWFFTIALPGYIQFRYPGKLLVLAAMGASLLAGIGWDRARTDTRAKLRSLLAGVAVFSAIGLIVTSIVAPWWSTWFANMPVSGFLGPVDLSGAYWNLLGSFAYSGLLALAFFLLMKNRQRSAQSTVQWVILAIAVTDLAVANSWMVATSSQTNARQVSPLKELIADAEERHKVVANGVVQPFRVHRHGALDPRQWMESSSTARLEEQNTFCRDTMVAKQHLANDLQMVSVFDTFTHFGHRQFLESAPWPMPRSNHPVLIQPRRALDALNAKYFVLPTPENDFYQLTTGLRRAWLDRGEQSQGFIPSGNPLPPATKSAGDWPKQHNLELLYNPDHLPRTWIVHDVVAVSPIESHDVNRITQLSLAINFPLDSPFDMRRQAIVESSDLDTRRMVDVQPDAREHCFVANYDSQQIVLDVQLTKSGLVVLSDLWERNWIARDQRGRTYPIVKTNRVMRGVWLEPGQYKLEFVYSPTRFYVGAWISVISWLILVVVFGVYCTAGRFKNRDRE